MFDVEGKGERDMTNNLIIDTPSSATPSVLVWLKEGLEPRKGLFEAPSEGSDRTLDLSRGHGSTSPFSMP